MKQKIKEILHLHKYILSMAEVPEHELDFLSAEAKLVVIPKKKILVSPGDVDYPMFFVYEGLLKTFYYDFEGEIYTKGFGAENSLVTPYVSFLTKSPANLGIAALEKTRALKFETNILDRLFARHPAWHIVGRKIVEALLIERERREQEMLLWNAEKRYTEFIRNFKHIINRIPLYEQASYLGITAVALSKIRSKN